MRADRFPPFSFAATMLPSMNGQPGTQAALAESCQDSGPIQRTAVRHWEPSLGLWEKPSLKRKTMMLPIWQLNIQPHFTPSRFNITFQG